MFIPLARNVVSVARRTRNQILNLIDTPVIVLLYHRVADLSTDPQLLAVSPENFRAQMMYLKGKFPLVSLEDDWAQVTKPSVAVTFDDGYKDNVLSALPILEEVGAPATFFVSTGNIDTVYEYWWDELERIILGSRTLPDSFTLRDNHIEKSYQTDTPAALVKFYENLQILMKNLDIESRQDLLRQLRLWAGTCEVGRESYKSLSIDELNYLASSKWVTIGAHTVNHPRLVILSEKQQREEVFASKYTLESILKKEVNTFSYPYGKKNDYDKTSIRLCREAGFTKAASNFPGHVYRWTDALQIPRYLIRNWDKETFAAKIKLLGV